MSVRDPEIGDELDGFQLTALLARGGVATVFKAVELATGEERVLKVPYVQYESDVVFYQRFVREEEIGRTVPSGRVKLLDFGIALVESARRLTWAGLSHAVGTPDYMAPEQIRGRRGDARTDVYALGTILYELLTGHLPFEGADVGALLELKRHAAPPAPPSTHLPGLDPRLQAVVLRAIAPDPRDRPAGVLAGLASLMWCTTPVLGPPSSAPAAARPAGGSP